MISETNQCLEFIFHDVQWGCWSTVLVISA